MSVGHIQAIIARCGLWWKDGSEEPQNKDQGMWPCGWGGSELLGICRVQTGLWATQSLSLEFYRFNLVLLAWFLHCVSNW